MSLADFSAQLAVQLEQAIDLAKHEAAQEFAAERHTWEQERLANQRLIEDANRVIADLRSELDGVKTEFAALCEDIRTALRSHE